MTVEYRILFNNFAALAQAFPRAASKIVREAAVEMVADIQQGMTSPHNGRVYTRKGREHVASAPGEMPAVDEGELIGSLAFEAQPGSTEAVVYVTPEYAPYLETGAPNAGIEPRPFMAPAAERAQPGFQAKLRNLEEFLRSAGTP